MKLDGKALRLRFNKRFMQMSRKNTPFEALRVLAVEALAIGVSTAIALAAWHHSTAVFVPVYALTVLMIGMRMRCFGNIVHECSHNAFVSDQAWNEAIGHALSIVLMYSFSAYRTGHMSHHKYTGDYDKDLDFIDTRKFEFHRTLNISRWRHYLSPVYFPAVIHAYGSRRFVDPREAPAWRAVRWIYVAGMLAAVVGIFLLNPVAVAVVALWVVPLAVALPLIGYLSDIMDHAGLLGNEADIEKSRNYIVESSLIQWLFFPRNDSYHLFHHLFPAVPTRYFPDCHLLLLRECPEYAARPHTFAAWMTDFRQREENVVAT